MNNKDVIDVLTSEIEWSENHLSDENRQVGEAFIKGLKQAIFLIKKYDEYNDLNNISVDSEYVTELEKKVEMFDEMLELLIQIDLWGMCPRKKIASINLIGRLDHVYMNESGNYVCEDIENILGRAKKIQGGE